VNIRILDFDASLTCQKNLLTEYHPEIIDFKDLSCSARLWMDKRTSEAIRYRIGELTGGISLFGSGDFHHISSLFTDKINDPATLIVFDLHPDWDILPPYLGCGSWVSRALRNKNIVKCLLIGPSSCDIYFPCIQSGNLKSLEDNRVEIYPYKSTASLVLLRKVPYNKSIRLKRGLLSAKIFWHDLEKENLRNFFSSAISELPTKKVYVSIDKDCLKNEYALTNWEEGMFSLDQLLMMLKLIKDNLDIIGLDITGEYSKCAYVQRWKGVVSRLDHPKNVKAETLEESTVSSVNETTNLKLLSVLKS